MDNIDTPITDGYNQEENMEKIRNELKKTGVVQLQKIMTTYHYGLIYNIIRVSQTRELIDVQKYKIRTIFLTDELEKLLKPVRQYLEKVLNRSVKKIAIMKAGHGDYTLLYDSQKTENGYDAVLDFTTTWDPSWGGLLYYRFMDKDVSLSVPCMLNSLVIINKEESKSYLKYINHKCGDRERLFIVLSL